MKKDIHPKYYPKATVVCSCGNTFTTGSTLEHIEVEICSACHPFYTGQQKLVDTEGRVERFEKKQHVAQQTLKEKTERSKKKEADREDDTPRTLREMVEKERQKLKKEDLAKAALKQVRRAEEEEKKKKR